MKTKLVQAIKSRQAVIGVVGLGYVGLPLMLRFVESDFDVIGFDIDSFKTDSLNKGESYIEHINGDRVGEASKTGRLSATTDFKRIREADALILCVPTPLGAHREPDLSYIIKTVESIIPNLRPGQVISLESTTYPGTTEEELRPRLEDCGFKVGEDIFLVYSPEREDPGNKNFTTQTIPKIVGGSSENCLEVGTALYDCIVDTVVPVKSTRVAEMAKLLENIYRAVNIGLVNELKIVADRMDINIHDVIDAAATKPFGFTPFYPGPGLGGHCIPIDPFYLTWKAHEYGVHTRFIELAGEVNTAMPEWVVGKVAEALNMRCKSLKNSTVLVLGLAYKKGIDDSRESPSAEIMDLLQKRGVNVIYSDPYIPTFPIKRKYQFDLSSVEVTPELLGRVDCVLIATAHEQFDYEAIANHSDLVVDTRGLYRKNLPNVVQA